MSDFTSEEKKQLEPYVSNTEGDVFCVRGLEGIVGAAYARYSRARYGFRETLLKEFVEKGVIDPHRAAQLIERILIAYGDDSVGELEGAHVSFENISILATKEIEGRRIGGSPIEQSTRYVFYDQKINGQYRYYRDPKIMASEFAQEYTTTMDFLFDTYCSLIEPMKEYYGSLKPKEEAEYDINGGGVKKRYFELSDESLRKAFTVTYNADLRTRACDTLRNLLPIATTTNMGVFGNGRFFQNVLSALYTSPYSEANNLAVKTHNELNKVIPVYVKRAKKNEYLAHNHNAMWALSKKILGHIEPESRYEEIDLLDRGEDAIVGRIKSESVVSSQFLQQFYQEEFDNFTITCMLYSYAQHPFRQIREIVRSLSPGKKQEIIKVYVGNRATRRDRPFRALECGYPLTFDLTTDFGTFKDLMRHRINTQLWQRFSPLLGFIVPDDLKTAGFTDKALECQERVVGLYKKLFPIFPFEASYLTLHGNKARWMIGMNDREAFHFLELRTVPQGHPLYRQVAQKMHAAIKRRSPWRAEAMKFVDHEDYFWTRADSEARQRVKEQELEDRLRQKSAD